ncbi:MBL fold metallo-hydrolase [Candidatus Roizmanbacteria bacterium]|nr:MBL fold metallo-hydrolase [Candidatus Roizmanbacteria bacterium]
MNPSPIEKKNLIRSFFFSLTIIFLIVIFQIQDKQTRIVFCNVGQGDATYIRIKNRVDVVIDAGPNRSILNCLGKYMPFWDHKIELAFLSHHDKDHYGGFFNIIDRYKIAKFLTIDYSFDSQTYKRLKNKLDVKKIFYQNLVAGDKVVVLNDSFRIYWPSSYFKSYQGNDYSLIFIFQENNFRALFTGDASPSVLNRLSDKSLTKVDVLKIPHHGSKNGLTETFLELADPKVAVISVGKNNSYGHPNKEVLDLLEAKKIKIKRTDKDGNVIFNLKVFP